ncbi:MAG: DNA-directed RNA polymerase subunit omega [Firmicutes bacterium]|nr:DNA-directed RNA polymerase subunit omega [Bacillota bacterium]MCL5038284.1 DNA-directed RNA polymerase subunit omega [Bacillota bacterium]
MIEPSLDVLLTRVDSKYTLVVAAAKRGRELMNGQPQLVDSRSSKPVTIALAEIAAGKVFYERTRDGLK